MSNVPDDGSRSGLMRAGVRARVTRLTGVVGTGVRRWSPHVILAVLSAGAFGPLLGPFLGTAGLSAAGIGALTAVGGNVLTDVVKAGVARLGPEGDPPQGADLEAELERGILRVLEAGGERAALLRGELAMVLREVGAVGAAVEAAVQTGDRDLQALLTASLAAVGEEFSEFGFVLADLRSGLRLLREGVDRNSADLQVSVGLQYRQATDTRLLLDQVAAIERRTRPGTAPDGGAAPPWADGSPYRGLVPFGEQDTRVFYGREVITAQLVATLSRRQNASGLLIVTGASGAGKSSVLRAGLIAAISRGELSEASRTWPRHVLDQPSGAPLTRLATLLAGLARLDAPTVLRVLEDRPEQAHLLVRQALDADSRRRDLPAASAAGNRLVLVVDQFEEIFAQAREREAFITALHSAATVPDGLDAPAALVVLAVRGDFIDQCASDSRLAEALQESPFVIGPMTETDLRRAITGPADAAGLELEPGLTDTVLSELRAPSGGYEAGALPLLSQTMLTIWEHREDTLLTGRGYALTGGVNHAVASSAEAAYNALSPRQQDLARQTFQRLTAISPAGTLTRRTLDRAALGAGYIGEERSELDGLLEVFARRRLIVVDADTAQIAHDVLLHSWPRLSGWLEQDLTGHALYSQLLDDADDWNRNRRAASYLYRGERLAAILHAQARWQAEPGRHTALTTVQNDFLAATTRARARSRRLRRTVLATLSTLLAFSLVATTLAVHSAEQADLQRARAVSRQLSTLSETLTTDPETAALLAAAAWRVGPTPEARAGLVTILSRPYRGAFAGHTDSVDAVAFSPDGRTLATAGADGTVRLWDVVSRRQLGEPLAGHTGAVTSVAFSPNGQTLASGGQDHTVRLWDAKTRRPNGQTLTGHTDLVNSVAFSPDGRTLAAAGEDRTVRLWSVDTRRALGGPLTVDAESVSSAAFSPDGAELATAGADGTVRLWDVVSRRQLGEPLAGHTGAVTSVAFSPNGQTLASGGQDHTVRLWDAKTRRPIGRPLTGHTEPILSVAFSPDGATLATGCAGGTGKFDVRGVDEMVRLWDVRSRRQIGEPLAGPGGATTVAFSPDGRTLATSGGDDTAWVWDVTAHRRLGEPLNGQISMDFSPDGRTLATVGSDTQLRLRDVETRALIGRPLPARAEEVTFSPDGRTLATRGVDGTVRLWDSIARTQIGAPLAGPITSVAFSPDGRILATSGTDGTVRLQDVVTRRELGMPLPHPQGEVNYLVFSPDGRNLAVVGDNGFGNLDVRRGVVGLWDVTTARRIGAPLEYDQPVASAVFSPDGGTLVTGSGNPKWGGGEVRLTDTRTGRHVTLDRGEVVYSVAFSPDGRTLATAGDTVRDKNAVRLWDMTTRRQLGIPLTGGPTETIYNVVFSPDGATLATSGGGSTVRLWDTTTRRQLGPALTGSAETGSAETGYGVAFSSDSHTLATLGDDGSLQLWDVGVPTDLVSAVCAITGRSLTREEWEQYVPAGEEFRPVCP